MCKPNNQINNRKISNSLQLLHHNHSIQSRILQMSMSHAVISKFSMINAITNPSPISVVKRSSSQRVTLKQTGAKPILNMIGMKMAIPIPESIPMPMVPVTIPNPIRITLQPRHHPRSPKLRLVPLNNTPIITKFID